MLFLRHCWTLIRETSVRAVPALLSPGQVLSHDTFGRESGTISNYSSKNRIPSTFFVSFGPAIQRQQKYIFNDYEC